MTSAGDAVRERIPERSRRALPIALVIVAAIVLFVGTFAVWIKRQVLETDNWVETSTELLQNEKIQEALADFLVAELYANVDVQAELEKGLPEDVKALAGPVSGGLRQLAGDVARRVLAEPRVQDLWEQANRAAHQQLIALIDDRSEAISTGGGTVTLDLGRILNAITNQLGISADLAAKLPADAAELEILTSSELETAQRGADALRTLAWVVAVLAIVLYGLAIWLAGGRRRETLRAAGISLIVVGALVLICHRIGGNQVVASLSEVASADDAVQAAWTISTSQLTEIADASILYGIFVVIAAWLAGPTSIATTIREATAPWFRQPRFAYTALAIFCVLLFWWSPTEGTRRLSLSLLLIALLVIGTEFLRRQVIREFPERVTSGSAEGIAQAIATRMREARARAMVRTAEARESAAAKVATSRPPSPAADERIEALERLARLHDQGVLSDEELAAEKQRILSSA